MSHTQSPETVAIHWFRRDLRLADNPALATAVDAGRGSVAAVYVVDPREWDELGSAQKAYLPRSLATLNEQLGGHLTVRFGPTAAVLSELAENLGAASIHAAADFTPFGKHQQGEVASHLREQGRELVLTGSPYVVAPGTLLTQAGTGFQVFTPFGRTWREATRECPPRPEVAPDQWVTSSEHPSQLPHLRAQTPEGLSLPTAGEIEAYRRWQDRLDAVQDYQVARDLPGVVGTSAVSIALRFGELHPRTLLADLSELQASDPATTVGAQTLASEFAWREFFADQLHRHPRATTEPLRGEFAAMPTDQDPAAIACWQRGETGFPIVDAGMRELLATGLMHNRVRMIVASFLIKDLHAPWQQGAAHFADRLLDHDVASNSLNWQWVAGCGTDAAPYFRVFNPTSQAGKFDPKASYQQRWIPELLTPGYPEPMLDHATERAESLRRWHELRKRPSG